MAQVGLFEAKQKLSELVERAAAGEEIIITCRGRERARLVAPQAGRRTAREVFASIACHRFKLPRGLAARDLINEGRRF